LGIMLDVVVGPIAGKNDAGEKENRYAQ
jgi:hypothetical protein